MDLQRIEATSTLIKRLLIASKGQISSEQVRDILNFLEEMQVCPYDDHQVVGYENHKDFDKALILVDEWALHEFHTSTKIQQGWWLVNEGSFGRRESRKGSPQHEDYQHLTSPHQSNLGSLQVVAVYTREEEKSGGRYYVEKYGWSFHILPADSPSGLDPVVERIMEDFDLLGRGEG